MPLLRITYHRGIMTDAQNAQLAKDVATVPLAGEVGQENQAGRKLSYVRRAVNQGVMR